MSQMTLTRRKNYSDMKKKSEIWR